MENTKAELNRFVKNWWFFLIIGVLLTVTGAWTFTRKDADFAGLTTLYIFLFVVNGALEIFFALSNRRVIPGWGGMLAFGALEVLLGLMLLAHPPDAVYVFQIIVGFWLLSRGMLLVLAALDLDVLGFSPDWMIFLVGGVLTTGLGVGVYLQQQVGFGTIVVWTGLAMILAGAFSILFSFKVKKTGSKITDTARKLEGINRHPVIARRSLICGSASRVWENRKRRKRAAALRPPNPLKSGRKNNRTANEKLREEIYRRRKNLWRLTLLSRR